MVTEKQVEAFEFRDLGVDHSQYFQGAGVAYTNWDEVFVGVGESAREAANDAVENMFSAVGTVPLNLSAEIEGEAVLADDTESAHADCDHDDNCEEQESGEFGDCFCHDGCELQHYVALYVRYAEDKPAWVPTGDVPGMGPKCVPCTAAGHLYCDCHAYCGDSCKVDA